MNRDHIVPQHYLKNFHTPASKGLVCSYKKGCSPRELSIARQIGFKFDYYRVSEGENNEHSKNNNHILSTFEHYTSPILQRIIECKKLSLIESERWTLAYFVSTLCVRNPSVHKFFEKQILDEQETQIKTIASQKSSFYALMREIEPNISDEMIEETRQAGLKPDEQLKVTLPNTENNKAYIRSLLTSPHYTILARRLFFYHWHLLEISSEKNFVTSDNPVVFLSPRFKDVLSLWQCPVFLPISPKLAFMIHPSSFAKRKIFIEGDLVDFYVKQSILFAKDFVFSHVESTEIQNLFDETKQNINNLNYQYNFLPEQKLKYLIAQGRIKI